jgi:hypothetical protein
MKHDIRLKAPLLAAGLLCAFAATPVMAQVVGSTAPSWVQSLTPGTWQAISTNTLASVDPADDPAANPNYPGNAPWSGGSGQSAVVNAWNGGVLATGYGSKGSMIVWGGGHQDYYGNEIYAFDLATRAWSRVTNPYAGSMSFPFADGIFPDGSPVPPHIYDQIEYHPATNSLVVLRTMASNVPNNVPVAAMFSFSTKTWRHSPSNSEQHQVSGGWSAYDRQRDVFWAEGGSGTTAFAKFDPKVSASGGRMGGWTNYSPKVEITDAVAAHDPDHDILLVPAFRSGTTIYAVDLKSPTSAAVTISQGGSAPSRQGGNGWEWSNLRKSFLYYGGSGAGLYELKLQGTDWRSGSWNWAALTSPSNNLTPQNPSGAPYSRFRLARYDDAEVAILVTAVNQPVYAFRVPGAGSIVRPNPPSNVTAQ